MPTRWRLLRAVYEDVDFAATIRNIMFLGAFIAILAEGISVVTTTIPRDLLGTTVAVIVFVITGLLAHRRAPRQVLAGCLFFMAAVLAWYHARMARFDPASIVVNQGALFLVVIGSQAVLELSLVEFVATVGIYIVTLTSILLATTDVQASSLALMSFYLAATVGFSMLGILGRMRLRNGQARARAELVALNEVLEAKVSEQVQRIQKSELLGRFLPPELADSLVSGDQAIGQVKRNVAVLCAAPAGFLESLARAGEGRVVELVNAYVSVASHVAFDHGGVIERVVGPRMTVIFGAVTEQSAEESVTQALATATAMQRELAALLLSWQRTGASDIKLRPAVGIAYGAAIVGVFGSERRVDYSALGGAMVRAVRLSSDAIPGEIRLDEAAALHVRDDYEVVGAESVEFTPGETSPSFVAQARGAAPARASEPARPSVVPPAGSTVTLTRVSGDSGPSRVLRTNLRVGDLFDGRYRLDALLGRGGTALVYQATHTALGQKRALKVIASERVSSADAIQQFRSEAEATARLRHPNVVRLHDFGRSIEGQYYLALDLVEGTTLSQYQALYGRIPLKRALQIGGDVLSALDAAHSMRLVHQDLKPSNVILGSDGRALVTDFGLVVFSGTQTANATLGGTPAYMSPEQWKNLALDGRSDLYAWGVMMYEMLTGQLPLHSTVVHEFAALATSTAPPRIHDLMPELPLYLAELIHACLAKLPEERPGSARDALDALAQV